MANKDRNKRSVRQARQRERAAQEQAQGTAASGSGTAPKAVVAQKGAGMVAVKGGKPGVFGRVRTYLRNVRTEMHRVVWPSRNELTNYSVAVVAMLVVFGVLVWAVDTGFVALLVAFTGLRG